MAIKTRRQMRAEVENFKDLVSERLGYRDIQKAVDELIGKAEDACIDDVGMPEGWDNTNDEHQVMFLEIVVEQLIKAYFTPQAEPEATIDDI